MITKEVFVPYDEISCSDQYGINYNAIYSLAMADKVNIKTYLNKTASEIFAYNLNFQGTLVLQTEYSEEEEFLTTSIEYIKVFPKKEQYKYNGAVYLVAKCKYTGAIYEIDITKEIL